MNPKDFFIIGAICMIIVSAFFWMYFTSKLCPKGYTEQWFCDEEEIKMWCETDYGKFISWGDNKTELMERDIEICINAPIFESECLQGHYECMKE